MSKQHRDGIDDLFAFMLEERSCFSQIVPLPKEIQEQIRSVFKDLLSLANESVETDGLTIRENQTGIKNQNAIYLAAIKLSSEFNLVIDHDVFWKSQTHPLIEADIRNSDENNLYKRLERTLKNSIENYSEKRSVFLTDFSLFLKTLQEAVSCDHALYKKSDAVLKVLAQYHPVIPSPRSMAHNKLLPIFRLN